MIDLLANFPLASLLPVTQGEVTLSEIRVGRITSLMPFKGRETAGSRALKNAHGLAFPMPGRSSGADEARVIWSGFGQAFLLGVKPDAGLAESFAITDQSDAWSVMQLEGAQATQVLARLCPLDLRDGEFKNGDTARSLIGHMHASITRTGHRRYLLMLPRSMTETAVREITEAMKSVAAC